jgi:asparagine synthase (glutamine-hydrolysing)
MCGIAGLFHFKSRKPPSPEALARANRVQAHRGPDDEGVWIHGATGFAHRRLAIIDLSEGHQPMLRLPQGSPDAAGRPLAVCFNGEIYNYRTLRRELQDEGVAFRTGSDTEVLLALYERHGVRCVERLNGQFAFALYDARADRLLVARDHLGQKPLYYMETGDGIVFASELKGLLALREGSPRLNAQALWDFLSLGYVTGEDAALGGVRVLRPGTRLIVEEGASRLETYWDIPLCGSDGTNGRMVAPSDGYESLVRLLLREAVSRALVADVPVGVFLSAGLDSSSILSLATEIQGAPLPTFTVDYEESSYAEGGDATAFARSLGSEHTLLPMGASDVPRLLDPVVWHTDSLQAMPSALPLYLVSQAAAARVKCVLHGGGGDEVFLGYPTYVADVLAVPFRWPAARVAARAGLAAMRLVPASHARVGLDYKARQFLSGAALPADRAHYHWRTIFSEQEKRQLVHPDLGADCHESFGAFEPALQRARSARVLDRGGFVDLKTWWVDMGLVQADGITMAHGLEARMPFMDPTLVEVAMGIPGDERLRYLRPKALLRRALRPLLPATLTRRRKMGFHVPLATWFRGPLHDWLADQLSPERVRRHGWFSMEVIQRLVREHDLRRADHSFRLWNLVVALRWKELVLDDGGRSGPHVN